MHKIYLHILLNIGIWNNGINLKTEPHGTLFVNLGESETVKVKVNFFTQLIYFGKIWLDL
jgi:hypothetical protein